MSKQASLSVESSRWTQFYALTKPRVVQLIVFCALIGMVLAVPGLPTLQQLAQMAIGVGGDRLDLLQLVCRRLFQLQAETLAGRRRWRQRRDRRHQFRPDPDGSGRSCAPGKSGDRS